MAAGVPEGVERPAPGSGVDELPAEAVGPVVLRPMRAGDVERVAELERACFTTPWKADTFRSLLEREPAVLTVAERASGEVVGYAVLWCFGEEAELANIAVVEEMRGRGYGSELLDAVLETARERGVRKLFLDVRVSNERAAALYERRGFREVGRRRRYYRNPMEDARVLVTSP